jgi:hypothetical protein
VVRQPDATVQFTPQDNQLTSKHRVLGFKPQLRLEWRGEVGQSETEQSDHFASLGDSITSSTRLGFSVQTGGPDSSPCEHYQPESLGMAFRGIKLAELFLNREGRV